MRKCIQFIGISLFFVVSLSATAAQQIELVILETSDIHNHVLGYDYYKDEPTEQYGLSYVSTLVKQMRDKHPEALLVDNGDTFQGNPLAELHARVKPVSNGRNHSMIKAMNAMNYDIATVGNHEFNYGLEYLQIILKGASFPFISSNIFWEGSKSHQKGEPFLPPYKILRRKISGESLNIGFIAFVPPQIMTYDARYLAGKVYTEDVLKNAKILVPKLRSSGADVVLVLMHGGIKPGAYRKMMPDAAYQLAALPGVDGVFTGHAHQSFPSPKSKLADPAIDQGKGTIHGKPVVMPGYWGSHLGVMKLSLVKTKGTWKVKNGQGELLSVKDVKEDPKIISIVQPDHKQALEYIRTPVGTFQKGMDSYFSRIEDEAITQLINIAQKDFVEKKLKGTRFEKVPVLSAAAAFKTGFGGSRDYAEVPKGKVALKHLADIYLYPNTIAAVEINGKTLKSWLERSAENFNQVLPSQKGEFDIINSKFSGYNFDIIDGVNYQIDISRPVGKRIKNLTFQGKKIHQKMQFVVATNNYRAFGGGHFPDLDGSNVIYEDTIENREIIVNYIREKKIVDIEADQNWSLLPIKESVATLIYKTTERAQAPAKKKSNVSFFKKDTDTEGMVWMKVKL